MSYKKVDIDSNLKHPRPIHSFLIMEVLCRTETQLSRNWVSTISTNLKISFGTFDPITIEIPSFSQSIIERQSDPESNIQTITRGIIPSEKPNDEGWILITH